MMHAQPILELRQICKEYPGIRALDDVSLTFRPGEIHGIVGENGAGKSTLIKILAGVVHADRGTILLHGRPHAIHSGRDARRSGLSFIHQELNLIPYFSCAENIFLGHPYPKTPWGTVSWRQLRMKTRAILQRLKAEIPLHLPVCRLSPGERAMAAIARAFAESASIYCMDEPTTALTEHEKQTLFAVIRNLKALGATVLYVSHDLDDMLALTDRVTVMRDGRVVGAWESGRLTKNRLISAMIGRDVHAAFPPKQAAIRDEVVLSLQEVSGAGVEQVTFELRRGEVLGIAGLLGAGRTELLRLIYGVGRRTHGTLRLHGQAFRPRSPQDSIKRGVVLVPEERRSQGLLLNRSVYENITLVYLNQLAAGLFPRRRLERREARQIGRTVRLKTADYTNPVATLSGGNQQKVVFAKYLLRQPAVLLLDEPTKGVDVGARFELYTVIQAMAARGTAVVLVSSDFSELLGLADRLLVLREGRPTALLANKQLDRDTLLHYC
jgi:ribose transport system ATP-binding protein